MRFWEEDSIGQPSKSYFLSKTFIGRKGFSEEYPLCQPIKTLFFSINLHRTERVFGRISPLSANKNLIFFHQP
jgi:hypothetical protein